MSKFITMSTTRLPLSPQPWLPLPYMRKAVKWLLEHGAAALFLDPGLRKTSITLAAFSFLLKRGVASKMLVIAPLKAAYRVWPPEVRKWKDFNHLRIVILHGPKKQQLLESDADIYVINPEGLEWLIYGQGNGRRFDSKRWKAFGFDTLCIDELTKFKHPSGVRFKAMKLVLDYFARRWGLTGSPSANGLLDLFGQCYMLDLGNALGRYITHYRLNYFHNPDGNGWKWVLRAGAKEKIYARIKPLALRMADSDYLELPEIVDVPYYLDFPPEAQQIYDRLEDELMAKIDEGLVVAANAVSAGGKLWQICNGGLYYGDDVASMLDGGEGRKSAVIHNEKTDWLESLIEELQGQPVLVCYQFKHDLERLQERFGKDIPVFGNNMKKNALIEDAWNRNELPFVFGQQDSIAHALNLQDGNARHVAHYSVTWNLEVWDQVLRRIRRSGNKAPQVFRHYAIMRESTDQDRLWALGSKNKGQLALFEALKARRATRN